MHYNSYDPQFAYANRMPPQMPPPWWWMPPQKGGGKKGKRGSVGRKPNLSDLLKEAIDNRDNLETVIERLAKKKDDKSGDKKDERNKKPMFSTWDTMLLLTLFALPLGLCQLAMAKVVLIGLQTLVK